MHIGHCTCLKHFQKDWLANSHHNGPYFDDFIIMLDGSL